MIRTKETKLIILRTRNLKRELTTNDFVTIAETCWEFILMSSLPRGSKEHFMS